MGMISGKRGNGWSDLPRELLESIADRLENSIDVSRFRSVCESWRSSAKPFSEPISFPLRLPHLGSPTNNADHSFSLLSQSTLYHLSHPPSSSSCLLKLRPQEDNGQRQTHLLVNPLSPLPITPLPESFPTEIDSSRFRVSELARAYSLHLSSGFSGYKVALSLPRSLVAVIAAGVLVELDLKSPDPRWRVIDDVSSQLSYQDVVLYNDRFVATDNNGRTVEIASGHKASVIARQVAASGGGDKKSLVVAGGELLLVDAYVAKGGRGERFRVYRLSESERRWDEVRTLEDDRVVFLGEDCSFSVPAGDLGPGFEGNCVIYRDPAFMVFTLRDRRVSSLAWRPEYAQLFHPPVPRRVHKDSVSCLFNSLCL